MLTEKIFAPLHWHGDKLELWCILGSAGPIRLDFEPAGHHRALAWLAASGERLQGITLLADPAAMDGLDNAAALLNSRLVAYFSGKARTLYRPLPPSPFLAAGTPLQRRVWQAIAAIPYGKTTTYGQLATKLGNPGLARAVGRACGANPCPLLIPCHRVVAGNSPGGFGGGLELKKTLLELERQEQR